MRCPICGMDLLKNKSMYHCPLCKKDFTERIKRTICRYCDDRIKTELILVEIQQKDFYEYQICCHCRFLYRGL